MTERKLPLCQACGEPIDTTVSDFWTDDRRTDTMIFKVLVCGDRDLKQTDHTWHNLFFSLDWLLFAGMTHLANGGERGADRVARYWYASTGGVDKVDYQEWKANWNLFGSAAGPIRNGRMLKEFQPDLVVAAHEDLNRSKGTRDMLMQATHAGVQCYRVSSKGLWPL